jgi:branched-chain amino acid transport system permease protein
MLRACTRFWRYGALALASVFLVLFPLSGDRVYMHLLIVVAYLSICVACFRMLMIVGRFSLGQSFFLGLGAYTSAILSTKVSLDPWLGLLLAGLAGAIVAIFLGMAILRVPGMYFAILTIALVVIAVELVRLFGDITGGWDGLRVPGFTIGSYSFGVERMPYYYLILVIAALSFLVMYRMERSPLGLILHGVGENDELIRHFGVNVTQYRLLVFAVTGSLTAIAGSFMAHYLRCITPMDMSLMKGIYIQIYAIVGGIGYFWGPVVGVLFLELTSHLLGITLYVKPLLLGGCLIIVFLFLPRGLMSLPERVRSYVNRRASRVFKAREWGEDAFSKDSLG